MDTKYQDETCTVTEDIKEVNCTLDWYAANGAPPSSPGSKVTPLYCGEQVFGEIEQAIINATKSINLIFWRMDEDTRLTAQSTKTIGQLLQEKANSGVKVKILLNKLTNPSFWKGIASDIFTPGVSVIANLLANDNIETAYRGFSGSDRDNMTEMLKSLNIEEWSKLELVLTKGASHHQKMVLVDCDDANLAKAFVLGLNMSPEYRDSLDHYYNYNPDAPDTNWQDLGCMVEGPIIQPIYWHFLNAWERTHERSLNHYPVINYINKGHHAPQFCCTQFQENKREILASYEKAINNAHNYIYMENQYFRYIPFAKQIKERAKQLQNDARQHNAAPDNDLYLFVLIHYDIENAIVNSMNTYRMLAELGQQQLMPGMQKSISDYNPDKWYSLKLITAEEKAKILTPEDEEHIGKVENVKDLTDPEKYGIDGDNKPFELFDIPGLKVVIGSLCTDSTKSAKGSTNGQPIEYRGITLHSKLLLVDDLFMSVGSANVHTRGFWTDSEANISLPDPDIAYDMRSTLWQAHADQSYDNSDFSSSETIKCDAKENFSHWNDMMDENWKLMGKKEALIGHLVRFWNDSSTSLHAAD